MGKAIKTLLIILACFSFTSISGQQFSGFRWAKRASEYEAQRFLMHDVYEVSSAEITELDIKQCGEYLNENEGFIFVLTAFRWKEQTGVVMTSLVMKNWGTNGEGFEFVNVMLTEKEYNNLNRTFAELAATKTRDNGHQILRFDNGFIAEYVNDINGKDVRLWIGENRHSFTIEGWNGFYKRFALFKRNIDN